ncbi:MAG: hypothetical protein BWZ10_02926 [candidate division BRC1 bacterium ADurb.BinA364]|nr:MAG: hypothetical protein BWZ10_02926 [candidate division BRC1 bacterium ADurb.BinA364]
MACIRPVRQFSIGAWPAAIAPFACKPVLYIAMKMHPASAATTAIIMRFRSIASRAWTDPLATLPGV